MNESIIISPYYIKPYVLSAFYTILHNLIILSGMCQSVLLSILIGILTSISSHTCEEPCSDVGSLVVFYTTLEPLRHDLRREPRDEQV